MGPEAIAFSGSGVVVVINIVGWVIAQNRSRVAIHEATEAARTVAKVELSQLEQTVRKLPCVRTDNYLVEEGRRAEKIEQLERKMDRLLKHLDDEKA